MSDDPYSHSLVSAAAEALLKPLYDLIERIAGPAADEVGLTLRDRIRIFRARRQIDLLTKSGEYIRLAGFTPREVAKKLLLPILDYASVEDDEYLHDAWAALLANSASPELADSVLPYFPEMLRQITHDEAFVLEMMSEIELVPTDARQARNRRAFRSQYLAWDVNTPTSKQVLTLGKTGHLSDAYFDLYTEESLHEAYKDRVLARAAYISSLVDFNKFVLGLLNLQRLGLICKRLVKVVDKGSDREHLRTAEHFSITPLGRAFILACQPPKHLHERTRAEK